jgi:hypothetical protein
MSDQDLVYLHRFSSRSIPTAQVLQVGQSAQATPPRAALNHDGKKLLLVTQGARELDPTRDEGRDALTPLKATCQGQPVSCYGVTLLSVDAKGRILLAGRALEATAQGAPLSHADDSVLLPVKNARGVTELVHFARGGLVKNRWTLPAHSTTGDLPTTWVDPHTVAVGPLLIKGQARLLRLDTREANNKPRLSQPLAGAPLGANLLPDGEGGVLVITAQEGQAPLLHTRLGPQGEELWRRPLPGPGQAATQSLRGDQLWVHSQAPQGAGWSALLTLSTGEALYKGGQANAAPLWLPQGQLVACLPEGLRWLDAKGAQKADLKLSWGCGALASVEGGDLLVASGPPGGAYRLSPPAQWSTP